MNTSCSCLPGAWSDGGWSQAKSSLLMTALSGINFGSCEQILSSEPNDIYPSDDARRWHISYNLAVDNSICSSDIESTIQFSCASRTASLPAWDTNLENVCDLQRISEYAANHNQRIRSHRGIRFSSSCRRTNMPEILLGQWFVFHNTEISISFQRNVCSMFCTEYYSLRQTGLYLLKQHSLKFTRR